MAQNRSEVTLLRNLSELMKNYGEILRTLAKALDQSGEFLKECMVRFGPFRPLESGNGRRHAPIELAFPAEVDRQPPAAAEAAISEEAEKPQAAVEVYVAGKRDKIDAAMRRNAMRKGKKKLGQMR
jgi:hypothetical protein